MSKVFSTKRTLSADRMFLNVYLRFQDFIFSPKIGYIEEKMKKRPKKMPLSEWKVLLFASKDAPLALLTLSQLCDLIFRWLKIKAIQNYRDKNGCPAV